MSTSSTITIHPSVEDIRFRDLSDFGNPLAEVRLGDDASILTRDAAVLDAIEQAVHEARAALLAASSEPVSA